MSPAQPPPETADQDRPGPVDALHDEGQAALEMAAELRSRVQRERRTVQELRASLQVRQDVQDSSDADTDTLPLPVVDAGEVVLTAPVGPPLAVTVRRAHGSCEVVVVGELDADAAPWVRQTLVDLVDTGERDLRLDLAGVPFTDSGGLSALLHARRWAAASGGRLRLTAVSPELQRLLRITGLHTVLLDGSD